MTAEEALKIGWDTPRTPQGIAAALLRAQIEVWLHSYHALSCIFSWTGGDECSCARGVSLRALESALAKLEAPDV